MQAMAMGDGLLVLGIGVDPKMTLAQQVFLVLLLGEKKKEEKVAPSKRTPRCPSRLLFLFVCVCVFVFLGGGATWAESYEKNKQLPTRLHHRCPF